MILKRRNIQESLSLRQINTLKCTFLHPIFFPTFHSRLISVAFNFTNIFQFSNPYVTRDFSSFLENALVFFPYVPSSFPSIWLTTSPLLTKSDKNLGIQNATHSQHISCFAMHWKYPEFFKILMPKRFWFNWFGVQPRHQGYRIHWVILYAAKTQNHRYLLSFTYKGTHTFPYKTLTTCH